MAACATRSAVEQVFAIPELLEHILLFVPQSNSVWAEGKNIAALRDVYRCQRVSWTFNAVIQASPRLQHIMSINPSRTEQQQHEHFGCAPNPMILDSCIKMQEYDLEFYNWDAKSGKVLVRCAVDLAAGLDYALPVRARNHASASWRRMRCVRGASDLRVRVFCYRSPDFDTTADMVTFDLSVDATLGCLVDTISNVRASIRSGEGRASTELNGINVVDWKHHT